MEKEGAHRYGTILTDTNALALKFHISKDLVTKVLYDYIDKVKSFVDYTLLDIHKYLDQDTYSFSTSKDWKTIHKILHQQRYTLFRGEKEETNYLFIIGGDDIIPVPSILNNNLFNIPDKYISTDFPYAYPSINNKDIVSFINSVSDKGIVYHIGRLPLGTDASFDILDDYLIRAQKMMSQGIPIQMIYAQCDPTWKRVTDKVVKGMPSHQLLPPVDIDSALCYNNILLSPYITCDSIDNVFNPYANLFYFNLHGSDEKSNPFFLGCSYDEETKHFYHAIGPSSFMKTNFDNVIVTEACYGAKFQGLLTSESILLTSLANNTLIYLGSSAVAWGNIDPKDEKNPVSICSADIMAQEFIHNMIGGMTSGEALTYAKVKLYNERNVEGLLAMIEFSLYGDPVLTTHFPKEIQGDGKNSYIPQRLSEKTIPDILITDTIYNEQADSLLSYIRQQVDRQFESVNKEIQAHLAEFGVKPRKLSTITRLRWGTETQHCYTYKTEDDEQIIVTINSKQVKNVICPKGRSVQERLLAASRVSINYRELFRQMSNRFGLIAFKNENKICMNSLWNDPLRGGKILLDNRIEDESVDQVRAFNTILDESFRKRMENFDIDGLGMKSIFAAIDFAALMAPLNIIVENELRSSAMKFLKAKGVKVPEKEKQTYGTMTIIMRENANTLKNVGIPYNYIELINKNKDLRNTSAHQGGITEQDFINYYTRFKQIVEDEAFEILMELKEMYNK